MYDELVKKIRHCVTDPMHCLSCDEPKDASCFVRLMTQAADAIEQLSNAGSAYGRGWTLGYDAGREESKPRWIPVSERLPETGVDVLVKFPQNMAVASIDIGEWVVNSGDGWCTDINLAGGEKNPTHWMPLPSTEGLNET
jgi:hypothetical protein